MAFCFKGKKMKSKGEKRVCVRLTHWDIMHAYAHTYTKGGSNKLYIALTYCFCRLEDVCRCFLGYRDHCVVVVDDSFAFWHTPYLSSVAQEQLH